MKKSIFVFFLSVVLIFSFASVSHSKWITIQLTNNSYDDTEPQINNSGHVVWQRLIGPSYEIFLYNGTSIIQLTDNSYDDVNPQINDSDYVVWTGDDGSDNEIFLATPPDAKAMPWMLLLSD